MKYLTPNQKIILEAIRRFFHESGKMPTIREIQKEAAKLGLRLKSLRSVFLYLNSLEEKGFIKKASRRRGIETRDQVRKRFANIPILGLASAGSPTVFAEQNIEGYLKISKKLTRNRKVFAVRIVGDSMNLISVNGKRIREGDFVLIDSTIRNFNNGDNVLVVIDGLATIKKFRKIDNKIIGLFPSSTNEKHKPIYLTPEDNFIINGKVIDVLRMFVRRKNRIGRK